MHSRFESCLKATLGFEGGLSDDRDDRGGRTNLGITAGTLERAKRMGLVRVETVDDLTREQAAQIYAALYWEPCKCGNLPEGLDLLAFDTAVNCGVGTAGKCLQKALKKMGPPVSVDGAIGPNTLRATSETWVSGKGKALLGSFLLERVAHYTRIIGSNPTQKKWIRGWLKRVMQLREMVEV